MSDKGISVQHTDSTHERPLDFGVGQLQVSKIGADDGSELYQALGKSVQTLCQRLNRSAKDAI